MKIRYGLLCILICLSFSILVYGAGNAVDLKLSMAKQPVAPDQARLIKIADKTYVSLSFFSVCLHAAANWDAEKTTATFKLGTLLVKMADGNPVITWGDKTITLSYAPMAMDGGFWIPLQLLDALGMESTIADDTVDIHWKHNYLLFIKSTTYEGSPAVIFQTTRDVVHRDFELKDPDRLVLDLEGVERFPYLEEDWAASYAMQKIRINQFSNDVFRMVFDLTRQVNYKIVAPDDGSHQVIVVFGALVRMVSLDPHNGDPRVAIDGESPLKYKTTVLTQPNRLVIDIYDATLFSPPEAISGDGVWIKRIRMAQFDPHTVRVVLDLVSTQACFVIASRQHPNHLEIRTQQVIQKIEWVTDGQGGALRVQSSGDIEEAFTRLQSPERLAIDLQYARVGLDCPQLITVNSTPIRGIKVIPGPSAVRLEMGLDYYLGYETTFSEDRRTMTIRMKESPLQGRIIVLDPGHGGADPGAMGGQGVREKEVNLEVALRLKDLLEDAGASVVLTRLDDQYVGLYERAAIANQVGAAIFISIHTNFHPDPKVTGIEIYHYPDRVNSHRLASLLLEEMTRATGLQPLSVKINKEFVVTRETQMPSVLVEMGFLSNYQEETTIGTTDFRDNMAHGIFLAIARYWNKNLDKVGERPTAATTDSQTVIPAVPSTPARQ